MSFNLSLYSKDTIVTRNFVVVVVEFMSLLFKGAKAFDEFL